MNRAVLPGPSSALALVLATACGPTVDALDPRADASPQADAGRRPPDATARADAGGPSIDAAVRFALTGTTETLPRRGGDGGDPYELTCPDGAIAVGVTGRSGLRLDAIQLVCAELLAGGGTGARSTSARTGGTGGSPFEERCSAGEAVVALRGRSGLEIDAIAIDCAPIPGWVPDGLGRHKQGPEHGGDGGEAFIDDCSPAHALVALAGRSLARVDALEATCAEIERR